MTLKLKPQGELKMGLTHVAVKLLNSHSNDTNDAYFLVDTGATDSMAPACELREIGLKPVGKRTYQLANGELVDYEYAKVDLRFLNEVVPTRIIFGPDDSEPILGVLALEWAGFIIDPTTRSLKKLDAFPLKNAVAVEIAIAG